MKREEFLKSLSDEQSDALNTMLIEQRTQLQTAFNDNEQQLLASKNDEIVSLQDQLGGDRVRYEEQITTLQTQTKSLQDQIDAFGGTEMAEDLKRQKRIDQLAQERIDNEKAFKDLGVDPTKL